MSHFVPKATAIDLFGNYSDFSFKSVSGRIGSVSRYAKSNLIDIYNYHVSRMWYEYHCSEKASAHVSQ